MVDYGKSQVRRIEDLHEDWNILKIRLFPLMLSGFIVIIALVLGSIWAGFVIAMLICFLSRESYKRELAGRAPCYSRISLFLIQKLPFIKPLVSGLEDLVILKDDYRE